LIKKRITFALLYQDGYFHLSRNFKLQKVGDLSWLINNFGFGITSNYIDELICILVKKNPSTKDKKMFFKDINELRKKIFIPITLGGGIKSVKDVSDYFNNGADKIILNTASLKDPKIIQLAAKEFGSQCVVVSVDAKLKNDDFFLMEKYGEQESKHNLIDYIKEIQDNNVGEIFLQSIDNDGSLLGYDFNLLKKIESHIKVPLIISCGAGNWSHVEEALKKDIVSAASLTNIFHFTEKSIKNLKNNLKDTILIRT